VKETGEPDTAGEVLTQAGATATTVKDDSGELIWEVRREHDRRVRRTSKLAHTSHWSEP
jgi:hypothetical protein